MSNYTLTELKLKGMLKQKEADLFSVRLRIAGGFVPTEHLSIIGKIAKEYGSGHIHLTTRQGIEIPGVRLENLEAVKNELEKNGVRIGVTGPSVRTITACQGDSCLNGIISAQALAREIDEKFYGYGGLPHKFKIGITGCPNACIKPYENDLGIMGVVKKSFYSEKCTLCKACTKICPANALEIRDGKIIFNEQKCVDCGKCTMVCKQNVWVSDFFGYRIYVGGKMGKTPHLGHIAFYFIEDKEKLFNIITKTLEFYKQYGYPKERFADCLDRISLDFYRNYIVSAI